MNCIFLWWPISHRKPSLSAIYCICGITKFLQQSDIMRRVSLHNWIYSLIYSLVHIIHIFDKLLRPYMDTFHIPYRYLSFLLILNIYIALGSTDTYSCKLLLWRICCSNIHILLYNCSSDAQKHEAAHGLSMFKPIVIIRMSYGNTSFENTVQFFQVLLWLACCEQRCCVKVLIYCAILHSLKNVVKIKHHM